MTGTLQGRHPATTTGTDGTPPAARAQAISPHTRAYAARHGGPATWEPEHFRAYLELEGTS